MARDDLQILRSGLNALMIRGSLFSSDDINRLKSLEREALALEKRRQNGETLSEQEIVRFNRFVLEALFPEQIGKFYVKGWRPVLLVYGSAGVAVAAAFWFCLRNAPAGHPWCNAAERSLISGNSDVPAAPAPSGAERFPLGEMVRSVSLWLSSISQFGTNVAWVFLVLYLPRYLLEIHHVPILDRSWMTAVPSLAGIAGMFLGGHLTDSLARRVGLRWGRALPMSLTRFFAAAMYVMSLWLESAWPATIAFAFVYFFVDLGVGATWAFMQDVGGKHVGSILGWGNMWGNFGAAVAPFLYKYVLGDFPKSADWNAMFVVCAAMFVVSGVAALWIDATVPIAKPAGPSRKDADGC
jgi:nitrate/nitrite transporter NarK